MRTRERIIDSAAREFAWRGYDGTSLRHVAAGAGLKLGSLYFHFATKDELLAEVLRGAVELATARIDEAVAELGPTPSGSDVLSAAIGAHLHVLHESYDIGAAVVRVIDQPAADASGVLDQSRRYFDTWRHLVAVSRGNANPTDGDRLTAILLLGAMNATLGRRQPDTSNLESIIAAVRHHFALS